MTNPPAFATERVCLALEALQSALRFGDDLATDEDRLNAYKLAMD